MQLLQTILSALALPAVGCFFLLVYLYLRNESKERRRRDETRADIADMTILFQTMRDVIKQQKDLAREFNQKMDNKMAMVKSILSQSMERNKELYEEQQTITQALQEAQTQLQRLQRQMALLKQPGRGLAESADLASLMEEPPPSPTPAQDAGASPGEPASPPPQAPPENPGPSANPPHQQLSLENTAFAEWASVDFDQEAPDPEPEEEEEESPNPPREPEDPQAARNAFRALLDLDPQSYRPPEESPGMAGTPPPSQGQPAPPPAEQGAHHNGADAKGALTPLQRRVREYQEAGMSVADISRELGIGKGEVRLMLSLIKKK